MQEASHVTSLIVARRDRPARSFRSTLHAVHRMWSRSLSQEAVEAALTYGRKMFVRGAQIFAIGRKEVAFYAARGIDLEDYSGVQVVCSHDGRIITAYRNHDFSRLRKGGHHGGRNRHVR